MISSLDLHVTGYLAIVEETDVTLESLYRQNADDTMIEDQKSQANQHSISPISTPNASPKNRRSIPNISNAQFASTKPWSANGIWM